MIATIRKILERRPPLLDVRSAVSSLKGWWCIDCHATVDLDIHLRCPRCGGESVCPR